MFMMLREFTVCWEKNKNMKLENKIATFYNINNIELY